MFISKYLPVNVKRSNAYVCAPTKIFPAGLLRKAEAFLRDGVGQDVTIEGNVVSFIKYPNVSWTVPDIYLACEALSTAEEADFSFYAICSEEGNPQLFVSKAFKKHRVLTCTYTFQSVIVTKPALVKRISAMIDHQFSFEYCMNVFNTIAAIEENRGKYLDSIIVGRDTEDECMIVNPITTLYAEDNIYYGKEVIEDYRRLLEDPEAECAHVKLVNGFAERKDVINFAPVTLQHAKSIVELYDKTTSKRNNYLTLVNQAFDVMYYVSTNLRYIVDANTFECKVITNEHMKTLLQNFIEQDFCDVRDLYRYWELL